MLYLPILRRHFIMKNAFLTTCLICCSALSGLSQSAPAITARVMRDSTAMLYAQTIKEADLNNYLSILASDALEGRDTGSRGQKMAAAFIREHFRDNSLDPIVIDGSDSSYFQAMELFRNYHGEVFVESNGKKYHHMNEVAFIGNANLPEPKSYVLQFTGDGEERDYDGLEVTGLMVAFIAKTADERRRKTKIARDKGAVAQLVVYRDTKSELEDYIKQNKHHLELETISKQEVRTGSNISFITSYDYLAELLDSTPEKMDKAYQKASKSYGKAFKKLNHPVTLMVEKISRKFETENVLGLVEGTDKRNEMIIITAHYDHVGKTGDLIYNGADDDGSGTASVMELAQAFAIAKKNGHGPRRSIIFMTVTAEEKGLLGSEYYSEHPVWPLNSTIANLNIDMIGRVDPAHEAQSGYVYVIGSDRLSADLHSINEQINKIYTGLELDYTYNDKDDPNRFYYRSDHYNFAKHNIPIIFYFNGTHDDYHQPTDTVDKIRFDLLKKRSELIFYTAWELANREERIRLNP